MALQLDRSLYSRTFNAETRTAIDAVNAEAAPFFSDRRFERAWGDHTTLRDKMDYLARYKAAHP